MIRRDGAGSDPQDEWYTPYDTALQVAEWLIQRLPADTRLLCPADILPDGSESAVPRAARDVGFVHVRVTRDLPTITKMSDWTPGEVVFTNPPFSLLSPFMMWVEMTQAKVCVLSRPATMRRCWPIPELGPTFRDEEGRTTAAAWMQNIEDTTGEHNQDETIGNCLSCERQACPRNYMTGHLTPRQDRPLYGWSRAVKNGRAGWFCTQYTVNGKRHFARFLGEYE